MNSSYDLEAYLASAQLAGYRLEPYDKWFRSLPAEVRFSGEFSALKKEYYMAFERRLSEINGTPVPRLCMFIQGDVGVGKTYTTLEVVRELNLSFIRNLSVGGIFPEHDAVIFDYEYFSVSDLKDLSDDTMHYLRRPNKKGASFWAGKYFIIVDTCSFDDYMLHHCYASYSDIWKLWSRFYVCGIFADSDGTGYLNVISRPHDRFMKERDALFKNFRLRFNRSISKYYGDVKGLHFHGAPDLSMYSSESELIKTVAAQTGMSVSEIKSLVDHV